MFYLYIILYVKGTPPTAPQGLYTNRTSNTYIYIYI